MSENNGKPKPKRTYKSRLPSYVNPSDKELMALISELGGKKERFLLAYAYVGSIVQASALAGCNFKSHFKFMDDPKYAKAFKEVQKESKLRLIGEAHRRAMTGSDKILALLLQRYFPKFRECKSYSVNAHIKHAGAVDVKHDFVSELLQSDIGEALLTDIAERMAGFVNSAPTPERNGISK